MCVLLQSERRALVAESFTNHLRWDACAKCDGGMGVPQVVEPDCRQVALRHDSLERLAVRLWVNRFTVLFAEDEIRVDVVGAPFVPVGLLCLAM